VRGTRSRTGRPRTRWHRRTAAVTLAGALASVAAIVAAAAPSAAADPAASPPVTPPAVTTPPPKPACVDTDGNGSVDNDGDGLCDNWETQGIDVNGDGVVDLKLYDDNRDGTITPNELPDPNVKDIYVELDYMLGLKPSDKAMSMVVSAFANAPHPIRLHLLLGDAIPFAVNTRFVRCGVVAGGCAPGTIGYFDAKSTYFGTRLERQSHNSPAVLAAKSFVFHYVLWVNHFTYEDGSGGYSGASETNGNDVVISLGDWGPTRGGTVPQQAGTLMHELGHNLGLHHGGNDDVNCKPNYLSIMNYLYQLPGMYVANRPLDFSRSTNPTLDKSALSEAAGVPAAPGWTVAFGPGSLRTSPTGVAIDWNGNGAIDPNPVAADVNNIDAICTGNGTQLTGFDDWANLQFAFYDNPGTFANGIRGQAVELEPTEAQAEAFAEAAIRR
jgi:hypothetical protein